MTNPKQNNQTVFRKRMLLNPFLIMSLILNIPLAFGLWAVEYVIERRKDVD